MLLGEVAGLPRFQINHPDHAVLGDQRHCEFGAHVRDSGDIGWIVGNVVDQNRLPQLRRAPGYPFSHLEPCPFSKVGRIACLKPEFQLLCLLIQEENCEDFVVDNLSHHLCHPLQGSVEVQGRGQHVCHV